MKKVTCILCCLVSSALFSWTSQARTVVFGAEWGANALVFQAFRYNIIDNSGSRYDDSGYNMTYHANGTFLLTAGINAGRFSRVSLSTGFTGIADGRRVIPLTMRYGIYPSGTNADGFLYYAEGGVGYDFTGVKPVGLLGSVGTGYHIVLSQNTAVNININARYANAHPMVGNPDGGGYVTTENTRQSNAQFLSLGFSLSLEF